MKPGLTGLELCKLLDEDPQYANPPIVSVSAKDDPESKPPSVPVQGNILRNILARMKLAER